MQTPTLLAIALLGLSSWSSHASIALTGTHTENFDTLASTGTTGTALPAGWALLETGTAANASYGVGTGSSNTGNSYSFGDALSTDRALGSLLSGSVSTVFGVQLSHQGAHALTGLNIAYDGEQWRLGTAGRSDRLDFQYSLDATSLQTGTWTDVDALDFNSVTTSGAPGQRDGHLNRLTISGSISGLNLAAGQQVWLRWQDFNASGADDGLAIDNFQVTAVTAVPEPETWALVIAGASAVAWARRRKA